jgi:dihydroorotate dehydrogenase (fumarate)
LVNSSNPWATSLEDIRALYSCPYTGAVTTRTSLLTGFSQTPTTHQYTFFSDLTGHATTKIDTSGAEGRGPVVDGETCSLNNLGYSPIPFKTYIEMIVRMSQDGELNRATVKPFIISVTGTAAEVADCYAHLIDVESQPDHFYPHPKGKQSHGLHFMMEINLSCPNIPDKPPPAYDGTSLIQYINAISTVRLAKTNNTSVLVGIKTPPYTYNAQFQTLISALEDTSTTHQPCPISFITATNTLGNCYLPDSQGQQPALSSANGSGIGGMAGDALHPLALGNVKTIREMLDASGQEDVRSISIIGVGGVKDGRGFRRMKSVGAEVVGVGTAFGRQGLAVFEKIAHDQEAT